MLKQKTIHDYFKPTIQNDAEELCRASAVMESMVDRLYYAENNLESNLKKVLEERDKVEEFENSSIQYFKDNGGLPEWYIRYKLGQKLTVGNYLLNLVDGKYKEENNFSVGYGGVIERYSWVEPRHRAIYVESSDDEEEIDITDESDTDNTDEIICESSVGEKEVKQEYKVSEIVKLIHWRFNYDVQDRDIEAEEYLKKTFNNYFFNKKVMIYSHEGVIWFKFVNEKSEECVDDFPWNDDDWIENSGYGTTQIINRILSEVHKQVFIRVGYKKKKERRLIGEFKNGRPKYKNFMVDDLTRPIYKFA